MKTLVVPILLAALAIVPTARADDPWTFSGFASLGAGRIADDGLSFMNYTSEKWSFDSDSVLGFQLRGNLRERLSFTAQIVSRGFNWDDTSEYEPRLEWAFLSYQFDPEWRGRLGRLRVPHYLFSETLDVGYSYVWVRPPVDVYSPILSPFSNFDGADLTWVGDWHDLAIDVQWQGGTVRRSRHSLEVKVEPLLGSNASLQWQNWTLRYGITLARTDIHDSALDPAEALYRAASAYSPGLTTLADSLQARDAWYRYQSAGLRWEKSEFTLLGEGFNIRNTEEGHATESDGGYVSAQYRIGVITPYLVRGYYKNRFNRQTLAPLDASYADLPVGYNSDLDDLRRLSAHFIALSNYAQHTWTAGLRWDATRDLALKAEWQRFDFANGGSGQLTQHADTVPDHTHALSFTADLVF